MPLIMLADDQGNLDMQRGFAFCSGLTEKGVYFHPWHNMFISAAMTDEDIDMTLEAADRVLADMSVDA